MPSSDLEYLRLKNLGNPLRRGLSRGKQSRSYSLDVLVCAADAGFRTLRSYHLLDPIRVTLILDQT
jgi:hypothetical protein